MVTNRSTKCGKPRLTLHCITNRRPHLAETVQHIFVGHLRPAVLLVPVGLGICHIDSQPRTNCGKPGGQKIWVSVRGQLSGNVKKNFPRVQVYCNGLCCIVENNCLKLDWKFHLRNTLKCKKKKTLSHRHARCKTHKPTPKHKETLLQTYEDTKRPAHEVHSKRLTSE